MRVQLEKIILTDFLYYRIQKYFLSTTEYAQGGVNYLHKLIKVLI